MILELKNLKIDQKSYFFDILVQGQFHLVPPEIDGIYLKMPKNNLLYVHVGRGIRVGAMGIGA